MSQIIIPVALVFVVGLVASVGLAIASRAFHVQEDEKFIAMRAELPGANCGGCGYAGCDDYAHALVEDPDGVPCTKCAVGGPACAEKLAAILGKSADGMEKQVAYVMCNGTTNNAKKLYEYADIPTCKAAKQLFGGSKVRISRPVRLPSSSSAAPRPAPTDVWDWATAKLPANLMPSMSSRASLS